MKYVRTLLVAAAASLIPFSTYATDYTQVQIGAGAMYFGLYERTQAFEDSIETEERAKPSVSLQISGQVFEKTSYLWFDMFIQQTDKSYTEFKTDTSNNSTEVHETGLSLFGLGGKMYMFETLPFRPYAKAGIFSARVDNTFTTSFANNSSQEVEINEVEQRTGYYAGGGAQQRINNKNSVALDYAAYKVRDVKNFQHNFQIGWVFHF